MCYPSIEQLIKRIPETVRSVVSAAAIVALSVAFAHSAIGQPLPFTDNFNDGDYVGWEVIDDPQPQHGPSNWTVRGGVLIQSSNIWSYGPVELETKYHLGTHVATGDKNWTDYNFNAVLRSSDNDGIGLIFRYQDESNYYRILLMNDPAWSGRDSSGTQVNTPLQRIQKFINGEPFILAENLVSQAFPRGNFALTAEVRGNTIRAYLNGNLILSAVDNEYSAGRIGLLSYANTGAYYDSVSVTTDPLIYSKPPEYRPSYAVREDRMPYIQNPTQTSVEIAWRTLNPSVGQVRYGLEKGFLGIEKVEDEPTQKHHVQLDGLQVNTRYYYEVYNDSHQMATEADFRTAPRHDTKKFSFLVLGDSGVDTPTQWRVGEQMESSMKANEVDFIVHVGDVHQGAGDYYDDIYFKPYREIIKHVNIFTSLGNHDVITDDGAVYLDDFYLPTNNAEGTERYYSFRWANAYFIALDTNGDYSPGSPQQRFLIDALTDSLRLSATWTFVYAHHPPFTEYWTNYYGDERVQNQLVPIYEEYDVDMVMNGHTHSYERGEKEHVHYLVTGGGGGGLDAFFVDYDHITFSDGVHHFTRIDVEDDELHVTATDQYGGQVDRFVVNKYVDLDVDTGTVPDAFELAQNFPNPFTDTTTIRYQIHEPEPVTMEVFDVAGRLITTLVDRNHIPGIYEVTYRADKLTSGNYVVRLSSPNRSASIQFTVVR